MSDYLWDQTGEPDEDVREMEELLGGLAYRPRPFEVPETLLERPARTAHLFSRGWLRIAAALLLMIATGAVLLSIRQQTETPEQQARTEEQPAVVTPQPEASVAGRNDESNGDQKSVAGNLAKPAKSPRTNSRTPRLVVAALPRKSHTSKRRTAVETVLTRQQIARHEGVWRQPKLTEEERRATEQLMLALRFASANLRYAQSQVREVGLNTASH